MQREPSKGTAEKAAAAGTGIVLLIVAAVFGVGILSVFILGSISSDKSEWDAREAYVAQSEVLSAEQQQRFDGDPQPMACDGPGLTGELEELDEIAFEGRLSASDVLHDVVDWLYGESATVGRGESVPGSGWTAAEQGDAKVFLHPNSQTPTHALMVRRAGPAEDWIAQRAIRCEPER